jgi:hypothetical protein
MYLVAPLNGNKHTRKSPFEQEEKDYEGIEVLPKRPCPPGSLTVSQRLSRKRSLWSGNPL